MNYETPSQFVAAIDNSGVIYEISAGRKRQAVGIDIQREQEILGQITERDALIEERDERIENYYNKLVELGVIIPEKTPAEIAQEAAAEQLAFVKEQAEQQAKVNQSLVEALAALTEKVSAMEGAKVSTPAKPKTKKGDEQDA